MSEPNIYSIQALDRVLRKGTQRYTMQETWVDNELIITFKEWMPGMPGYSGTKQHLLHMALNAAWEQLCKAQRQHNLTIDRFYAIQNAQQSIQASSDSQEPSPESSP